MPLITRVLTSRPCACTAGAAVIWNNRAESRHPAGQITTGIAGQLGLAVLRARLQRYERSELCSGRHAALVLLTRVTESASQAGVW